MGGQPVPDGKQLGRCVLLQLRKLGLQDLQGQLAVQQRVVVGGADQVPVPVVFHEPVVRVCRKRQGVQVQGVEGRHVQQPQSCVQRSQLREVEREYVVARDVVRPGGHPVEFEQMPPG